MFTIWLCGLFIIHPTSAYLGPFICLCYDRRPLFFLFFAFETAACVLTAECHSDKGWRTFGSQGKCSYRLMFVVFHFVFFDPSADAGCCLLMVRLLFLTGFRENGRRVQRPGRNGHRWSRGGLPQYDRLQKGKSACAFCEMGKRLCWEAVTRIRAPDSSLVCMNVYLPHTHWFHCQVSGSLFPLSYNKLLSLRDPLPTTVSQHWQTRAQQSFNKFSIPSVDGFGSKRAFGDMCNYHIPIVPSLPLAAVWLERFSSIGG